MDPLVSGSDYILLATRQDLDDISKASEWVDARTLKLRAEALVDVGKRAELGCVVDVAERCKKAMQEAFAAGGGDEVLTLEKFEELDCTAPWMVECYTSATRVLHECYTSSETWKMVEWIYFLLPKVDVLMSLSAGTPSRSALDLYMYMYRSLNHRSAGFSRQFPTVFQ